MMTVNLTTRVVFCVSIPIAIYSLYWLWTSETFFVQQEKIPAAFQQTYYSLSKCIKFESEAVTKEGNTIINCLLLYKPQLEKISKKTFTVITQESYSDCLSFASLVDNSQSALHIIRRCTINNRKLDKSITELSMSIMHIKTYLIFISVIVIVYLVYQCYIHKSDQKMVTGDQKVFRQLQYAPGVIVQKTSSYHMTQPNHMNQFKFPGTKDLDNVETQSEAKPYNLKDFEDFKNEEISLSNVSTPKKKIEVLSIEPVKKVDTNNILEELDGLSLEFSEKENVKDDFKFKIHAVAHKEKDKNGNNSNDDTLSLDSEKIAKRVAMNVIDSNDKTETEIKTNMNSPPLNQIVKGHNSRLFSPYAINGWIPPVQYNNNISPVNMTHFSNMNNMNNNNLIQPIPMSPLGSMHHLNQLNGAILMRPPFQNNQYNPSNGNKSRSFPRPNIW